MGGRGGGGGGWRSHLKEPGMLIRDFELELIGD